MKIAVWFSCGAASAVAAKVTLDTYERTVMFIYLTTLYLRKARTTRDFYVMYRIG